MRLSWNVCLHSASFKDLPMQTAARHILQYFALPALAGAVWISLPNPHAQARPQYLKQFSVSYPELKEPLTETKCGVCHAGPTKKEHKPYGKAILTALGKGENIKDPKTIAAALIAAEKHPSGVKGKTFGDLIKSGKLPE